jgi:hypothetical protein
MAAQLYPLFTVFVSKHDFQAFVIVNYHPEDNTYGCNPTYQFTTWDTIKRITVASEYEKHLPNEDYIMLGHYVFPFILQKLDEAFLQGKMHSRLLKTTH